MTFHPQTLSPKSGSCGRCSVLLSYVSVEQPNSKARVVALLSTLNNSSLAPRMLALWDGIPKIADSSADAVAQLVRASVVSFHKQHASHCSWVSAGQLCPTLGRALEGQLVVSGELIRTACHQPPLNSVLHLLTNRMHAPTR